MVQEGLSTGQKLAAVFNEYGHASVFDMVPVFLYIDQVSQLAADDVFNETNMGGGQQRSTRFVRQTDAGFQITPLPQLTDRDRRVAILVQFRLGSTASACHQTLLTCPWGSSPISVDGVQLVWALPLRFDHSG